MQPAGSGVRPVGRNGHMIFPNRSAIEWTNATWNPVTGCTRVSAGCDHCYAARMTYRLERMRNDRYTGLTVLNNKEDRHFSGVVRCHEDLLDQPLHWRNPRRIFLCSMSDLFHPKVPFDFIDLVFAVMARCQQHTFQVLTKQPERMAEYCNYLESHEHSVAEQWVDAAETLYFNGHDWSIENAQDLHDQHIYPLPNVWLGTSLENQETADRRIPQLLECSTAFRFLSCEPLLGPVDLTHHIYSFVDPVDDGRSPLDPSKFSDGPIRWVIVGGESGPGARPMDPDWPRSIRDQCVKAGVAFFMKQMAKKEPIPNDLMVREYPVTRASRSA